MVAAWRFAANAWQLFCQKPPRLNQMASASAEAMIDNTGLVEEQNISAAVLQESQGPPDMGTQPVTASPTNVKS